MRTTALIIALALGLTFSPAAAEAKNKPYKTAVKTKSGKNKAYNAAAKKRKAPKRKGTKKKGAN